MCNVLPYYYNEQFELLEFDMKMILKQKKYFLFLIQNFFSLK